MLIKILDNVHCQASADLIPKITPCLEYQKQLFLQGPFAKKKRIVPAFFIHRRTGIFLTGLLPRVEKYLNDSGTAYEVEGDVERLCPAWNEPNMGEVTLRDYQEQAVKDAIEKQRGVIQAATGSGKTVTAIALIKSFDPSTKVLFLCHSLSILKQTVKEMARYGIRASMVSGEDKDLSGEVICATIQTMSKANPQWYCDYFDITIIDECFHPKTEVLTEYGWQPIKNLKRKTQVAQYDFYTEEVSFAKPTKYIEQDFSGRLYRLSGRQTEILCTPNHQQPYYKSNGTKDKKEFERWKFSKAHFIPISGKTFSGNTLTPLERFMVATSADGTYHRKGINHTSFLFSFSKVRKIKRFLQIVKQGGFQFSEVKSHTTKNRRGKLRRRWIVRLEGIYKKGLKYIKPLPDISYQWGQDFLEEILLWDGSTRTVNYWSGTNPDDADYIQAVAALSGITCNRTIQTDDRKETYKDVHRITLVETDRRKCSGLDLDSIPYEGKVVCIRVPKGNLIIRSNNKVSISGNCHHCNSVTSQYGKFMSKNLSPIRIGFTATIPPERERMLALEGLLGPVIDSLSLEEGIEMKVLAKPKVILVNVPFNKTIAANSNYKTTYHAGIVKNVTRNRIIIQQVRGFWKQNKTSLILIKEIEHGERLLELAGNTRGGMYFVRGSMENEERETIRQLLIEKKIQAVIATSTWKEGIDIPTLDVVIYAAGYKSEIATLQSLGRVFRAAEGKERGIVVDFLDPYRYLAEATVQRLQIYQEQGWLTI